MNLISFTNKFLPNYKERFDAFDRQERSKGIEAGITLSFCLSNFPEALQNYTDMMCEKQRENCSEAIETGIGYYELVRRVDNAEQPEIDRI